MDMKIWAMLVPD